MPVSWFWIRQRPQFLAKELSTHYSVTVACLHDYNCDEKLKQAEEQNDNFRLKSFPEIRTKKQTALYRRLRFLAKKAYFNWLLLNTDIVVMTVPQHVNYCIKGVLKKKVVVYDCMDDMLAFQYENDTVKNMISTFEEKLCKQASHIFLTSDTLKYRIQKRYGLPQQKLTVLNNGIRPLSFLNANLNNLQQYFADKSYRYLVYFGTIAEWFDMDLLVQLLNRHLNVKLVLFGPVDTNLVSHPQITYGGILAHNQIESVMMLADTLIMPFKITELILAVNPVKAYEYIASGKPVILTKYGETEKFGDYCYLYNGYESLDQLFDSLSKGELKAKKSIEECRAFGNDNKWDKRASLFYSTIKETEP